MNKQIRVLVFTLAALGMGITMPSCPGQEAMQQQIDGLTAKNADMTRKMAAMSATVDSAAKELNDAKQLLTQLGPALEAQKNAMTTMSTQIQDIQSKMAAHAQMGSRSGANSAKKPLKRHR